MLLMVTLTTCSAAGAESECAEVYSSTHHEVVAAALRPRWIARGSAIYVDRVTEDSRSLIESTVNPGEQLNADALNFSQRLRYDVAITRLAWYDGGFDLRFLDFGTLSASAFVPVGNALTQINSAPPVQFPNVRSIDARYETEFYSIELNYFYPVYDFLSVLVGFRYVNLDDEIRASLDASPQTFSVQASARNDLYGGQFGLITIPYEPLFPGLWISSYGKIGIYANDADNRSFVDTGVTRLPVNVSADNSSVVGEFAILADWRIHPAVSIVGGYNLLFLERVAVAADQISATDFFNATGSDDDGGVLFHGASLAIEVRFP